MPDRVAQDAIARPGIQHETPARNAPSLYRFRRSNTALREFLRWMPDLAMRLRRTRSGMTTGQAVRPS